MLRDTISLSLILGSAFCLRLGVFGLRICFALHEFRGKAENDSMEFQAVKRSPPGRGCAEVAQRGLSPVIKCWAELLICLEANLCLFWECSVLAVSPQLVLALRVTPGVPRAGKFLLCKVFSSPAGSVCFFKYKKVYFRVF